VDQKGQAETVCSVENNSPNPESREAVDPQDLEDLAKSIREKGHPALTCARRRGTEHSDRCGKRRCVRRNGNSCPAADLIVPNLPTSKSEVAIIENIQRADLKLESRGCRVIASYGPFRQRRKMAEAWVKASNCETYCGFLELPENDAGLVRQGDLTAGHHGPCSVKNPEKACEQLLRRLS